MTLDKINHCLKHQRNDGSYWELALSSICRMQISFKKLRFMTLLKYCLMIVYGAWFKYRDYEEMVLFYVTSRFPYITKFELPLYLLTLIGKTSEWVHW